MKTTGTTPQAENIERKDVKDEVDLAKYLDGYMSREAEPTKLLAFLLFQWALQGGDTAREIETVLRKHAGVYIGKPGWQGGISEDASILIEMHQLIDYWRYTSGAESQATNVEGSEQERDSGDLTEQRVKEWLLSQDVKTKLAALILNGYSLDDHGTKELWDSIMGSYEDDVFDLLKNPPESATAEELYLAGVFGELSVWRNHY